MDNYRNVTKRRIKRGNEPIATTGESLYPVEDLYKYIPNIKAIATGEFREPKKGEFYLSGCPIDAYQAPNDLSTKYFIAKIVRIKRIVTFEIIKEFELGEHITRH